MLGLNYRPLVFEKLGDNLNFFQPHNKTAITQELYFMEGGNVSKNRLL